MPIIIPFVRFNHAMSVVIRKINENEYIIYFMNTGDGTQYHSSKIVGSNIYTKAISEYKVNKNVLSLFLVSILINNHTSCEDFYSSVIFMLESNNIKSNLDNKNFSMNENTDNNDVYYYKPQVSGDCTSRSFILPLYLYSNVICDHYNNFYEELLFLIRLMIASMIDFKYDPSTSSNDDYIIATYTYQYIQKYINDTNYSRIPHIYSIVQALDANYNNKLAINSSLHTINEIKNITMSVIKYSSTSIDIIQRYRKLKPDIIQENHTEYTLQELKTKLASYFLPFIDYCLNYTETIASLNPNYMRIDSSEQLKLDKQLSRFEFLSCNVKMSKYNNNYVFLDINKHINKLFELALSCKIIFADCFNIGPAPSSNRFLNKIYGDIKYINPALYNDFISIISPKINYLHRKKPIFSYLDYIFNQNNYKIAAEHIWTKLTFKNTYSKDINATELIPSKYEIIVPINIYSYTDAQISDIIIPTKLASIFYSRIQKDLIICVKDHKKNNYYLMLENRKYTLITGQFNAKSKGDDIVSWIKKFLDRCSALKDKIDRILSRIISNIDNVIGVLEKFINDIHNIEYQIEQYI